MALTAGALSIVSVSPNSCVLNSAVATGGTGPYTYQWYMSTTSGFTPGSGNLVSGATNAGASNQSFSSLSPNQTYFFVVIATDTSDDSTVTSSQLAVTTSLYPVLNAKDTFKVGEQIGSQAAAKDLMNAISLAKLPSVATQKILAVAFCDRYENQYNAVHEFLNAIVSGNHLSLKTQKKVVITMADAVLANKLINVIQSVPTAIIHI